MKNYKDLQDTIDKVIGKIGLEQTMLLLEGFINNAPIHNKSRKKMISDYIVEASIETFHLNKKTFLTNGERDYRDARYCCFHLMRKYVDNTMVKTARFFDVSDSQVQYGYNVVAERLAFPKSYPKFIANYNTIESRIVTLLGKGE